MYIFKTLTSNGFNYRSYRTISIYLEVLDLTFDHNYVERNYGRISRKHEFIWYLYIIVLYFEVIVLLFYIYDRCQQLSTPVLRYDIQQIGSMHMNIRLCLCLYIHETEMHAYEHKDMFMLLHSRNRKIPPQIS